MTMKYKLYTCFTLLLALAAGISSCKKDNYEAPKSTLSGRVVFQGQPVGVRSNGTQLQIWQRGYAFFTPIAVYIDQTGRFSALLFDGDYKITRVAGAPWLPQTDSVSVKVSGDTQIDVPVSPYSVVSNAAYTRNGTTITANITVQKAQATSQIEAVRLYVFRTTLVDQNNADATTNVDGTTVTSGQAFTANVTVPASLTSAEAVYVRVGVKTAGVNELAYSAPTKIQLR